MTELNKKDASSLDFIKEVAKYFMDFLETDFHKRKNPKRSIKLRNEDNLLLGLNLSKYPSFSKTIQNTINQNFSTTVPLSIEKGVHRTNIPRNLLDLITLQLKAITSGQVSEVIDAVGDKVTQASTLYKEEYDQALNFSLAEATTIIKEKLVLPFIRSIERSLQNMELGDENSTYLMEEELSAVLLRLMENKISEVIKKQLVGADVDVSREIKGLFSLSEIKTNIRKFFENFQVTDIFSEILEMERNKNILDKQDFYLYFFDITFNRAKYPIFYIPFNIVKHDDKISFDFDAQLFINKKALEYIAQEYNKEKGKQGKLKTISERIIYIAQHEHDLTEALNNILSEIVNFFELDTKLTSLNPQSLVSKSLLVRASNSCYIGLFEKSDEALVNDYEEILRLLAGNDSKLAGEFNKLIDDFIHKNPEPFNLAVEDEWDGLGISDKLVFTTPIPLNSEQRQILSAIRKEGCKYITVEGPPGTGKSHTITAIVCDAILRNQSTLVLSDKKEALDVVEDKITETMNKVRHDKSFQNPILRLGKTGSTYSQILSTASIENIKLHSRVIKKEYKELETNIEKLSNTLKEDLEAETLKYAEIDLKRVEELLELEAYYETNVCSIEKDEAVNQVGSVIELEEIRRLSLFLKEKILLVNPEQKGSLTFFNLTHKDFKNLEIFRSFLKTTPILENKVVFLKEKYAHRLIHLKNFAEFTNSDLMVLERFLLQCYKLKHKVFGYLFKSAQLKEIEEEFNKLLPNSKFSCPHKEVLKIEAVRVIFNDVISFQNEIGFVGSPKIDYVNLFFKLLISTGIPSEFSQLKEIAKDIDFLVIAINKYPKTIQLPDGDHVTLEPFINNKLAKMSEADFERFISYVDVQQTLLKSFNGLIKTNYSKQKKHIEELVTTRMTHLMDNRLINFYENNRADAKTLRDIIKSKQKFPKDEFLKIKEAFPCILAGIRDYAEYIPLEPEIFDLVIIDEASQVSIAQAFPALLRAKKVLILGDKKQFSNIKASQARSETNREYLNSLEASFKTFISFDTSKLVKLGKFNIKTSILDFFEFITNYNTQLMKHFRGYKEIIGYSNKHFYKDSLQVMKIRGKSIEEVIKFSFVTPDPEEFISSELLGNGETLQNANISEINFIILKLKEFKDSGMDVSVGIITPHTNQQKLIIEMISKLPNKDYYFEKMNLKIMTFDTCQGEERDVVFYSMVATKESDRLWGVFIKDLNSVDVEEDGKIKAQRLNVGFSRSKECIHFVLSKPLEDFSGAVGEALRYYWNIKQEALREPLPDVVDINSPMEKKVLNWLVQTAFWKEGASLGKVTLMPQFEIGKYLKQLDKTYNHPKYKVDFLLVYKEGINKERKIIIEYDGFASHFTNHDEVNGVNYSFYYSDEDLYREKVLESYGYKFLRINRFNLGKNQIETLNARLLSLIEDKHIPNAMLSNIHETIEGLHNGSMKECPKCKEFRDWDDFNDVTLSSGHGRFCKFCKKAGRKTSSVKPETPKVDASIRCPKCLSAMVLRNGSRGKFYGCSQFPRCRGTRFYR
jgi:superfamily I DNA and/or RNA helicase/very-short-patch-repair endonuclease